MPFEDSHQLESFKIITFAINQRMKKLIPPMKR